METAVWTVPSERMKKGVAHRVPLSSAALQILDDAKEISDDSDMIFPSPRRARKGKGISVSALMLILGNVGLAEQATIHGFRSSFRDYASECTNASWMAMELSLAHLIGSATERAYARSDLLDQRRDLLNLWADYCVNHK